MKKEKSKYVMSSRLEDFCNKKPELKNTINNIISDSEKDLGDFWIDFMTPEAGIEEEDLVYFYSIITEKLLHIEDHIKDLMKKNEYSMFLQIISMKELADTVKHFDSVNYYDYDDKEVYNYLLSFATRYNNYIDKYNELFDESKTLNKEYEAYTVILDKVYNKVEELKQLHPDWFEEKDDVE